MRSFSRRHVRRRADSTPALFERLEDRVLLSVDVLVADRNPATTQLANSQNDPAIGISLNGTIVVAWANVSTSTNTDVRFRRYTSDGTPLDAADRSVSLATSLREENPSVAVAPDGSFVIAYAAYKASGDADIAFDFYDANGAFVRRVVEPSPAGIIAFEPDIAITPSGTIAAIWTRTGTGTGGGDILARVFDSQGDPLTGLIVVAGTSGTLEESPAIAIDPDGNFVVTYEVSDSAVAVQRFSADGSALAARQFIDPPGASAGDLFTRPDVDRAYDGSFVVAYTAFPTTGGSFGYWHVFNADGSQRAEGAANPLSGSSGDVSVGMDIYGNFAVGYTRITAGGDYQAEATFFDSTGRQADTVAVNQDATGNQFDSKVAIKNNLLAGSYFDASGGGDVEFSVIEQRRGKFGVARPNAGGGLTFFLDSNATQAFDAFDAVFDFGLAGDIVVVGDWNADGADDLGVGRPNGSGGLTFFLDSNGNRGFDGSDAVFDFGLEGDIIVVGDWNGDGIDDLGVARPNGSGGLVFSLDANGNRGFDASDSVFNYGLVGDIIVIGDWDGNGIDQLAVARPNSTGGLTFSLDLNASRFWEPDQDVAFNYGLDGDGIAVGDWDGDGTDALGVVRPNGTGGQQIYPDLNENYLFDLTDALFAFDFGLADDLLVVGSWEQTALRSA